MVSLSMLVRAEASARQSRVMGRRPGGRFAAFDYSSAAAEGRRRRKNHHRPTRTDRRRRQSAAAPHLLATSTDAPGADRLVCCQRARLHRGAMCAFRSVPPDRGLELNVVAD